MQQTEPTRIPVTDSPGTSASSIRVAFVMHEMQVAGAEKLVESIIDRLQSEVIPAIYCLDRVGSLGEEMQAKGVQVESLNRRPGLDLSMARKLVRAIRRDRIQIVHAHQYTPFFYSALARLTTTDNFRIVFTEHGRHFPDVVSSKRRWANRILLGRQADEINACSQFSCRALADLDGFRRREPKVIRNGVEVRRYSRTVGRLQACERLGLDPDRRYISAIARFHPVKDHETLVRGFAALANQRKDTDLLLAGDGPLREQIEALSRELGCRPRVHFLGVVDDVRLVLEVSELFCLTSLSEAASLTILEAMASEVPVVATEVGGNPEMIESGTEGLLVPRRDSKRLAQALSALLEDGERAREMGRSGRQKVENLYQLEDTVDAYAELYRGLAEKM